MAYTSASNVAARCQNLIAPNDRFTTSSSPTITEINYWLSSGCAVIETALQSRGYNIPVAATATVYDQIADLNGLWGSAWAELTRANVTLSPQERTRGQFFLEQFWMQLDRLLKMDLTLAGVGANAQGAIYTGGISRADKQSYETDTDRVNPRFARDMFKFDGVIDPTNTTAS